MLTGVVGLETSDKIVNKQSTHCRAACGTIPAGVSRVVLLACCAAVVTIGLTGESAHVMLVIVCGSTQDEMDKYAPGASSENTLLLSRAGVTLLTTTGWHQYLPSH